MLELTHEKISAGIDEGASDARNRAYEMNEKFTPIPNIVNSTSVILSTDMARSLDPDNQAATTAALVPVISDLTHDVNAKFKPFLLTRVSEGIISHFGIKHIDRELFGDTNVWSEKISTKEGEREVVRVAVNQQGKLFLMPETEDGELIPITEFGFEESKQLDSDNVFEYSYTKNENPVKPAEIAGYREAVSATGDAVGEYIQRVIDTLGIKVDWEKLKGIYNSSSIYDSIEVVAKIFKRNGVDLGNFDVAAFSPQFLKEMLKKDHYEKLTISKTLKARNKSTDNRAVRRARSIGVSVDDYYRLLEIKLRVNQAAWYVSQDERAIYERKGSRFTSSLLKNYTDAMMGKFAESIQNYSAPETIEYINNKGIDLKSLGKNLASRVSPKITIKQIADIVDIIPQESNKVTENDQKLIDSVYFSIVRTGFEAHKDMIQPI